MSRSAVAMALGWNFRRIEGIETGSRYARYAEVVALLDLYGSAWRELTALEDETNSDG